jgi:hypothetical protein
MSGYQHLQKYKGSLYGNPNYSGIEYDYEVPDNLVVASPGGVSGIHHHYTKGIYSDASSTQDIHAGNGNADAYPYGEYGNMYQVGQSSTRYMGDFVEPADLNGVTGFTQNQGEPRKEYFKYLSPGNTGSLLDERRGKNDTNDIELISPGRPVSPKREEHTTPIPGMQDITDDADDVVEHKTLSLMSVLKIMAVFTVGYIAVNFWVKGSEDFINTRFYNGEPMTWKQSLTVAFIFTILLLICAYVFGIPLITLEKI